MSKIPSTPTAAGLMPSSTGFAWPGGKRAALSITFDDAWVTQVDVGVPILETHGLRGTFYVSLAQMSERVDKWKAAIACGHEVGNHTVTHPCSGNFGFVQKNGNALETYTLEKMEEELTGASARLRETLGIIPTTFAYPCGQKFVGRGTETRSYIPLVAKHFLAGRSYNDEAPNRPDFCDLAQLTGIGFDGRSFDWIRPHVDGAVAGGAWLILVGHTVDQRGSGLNVSRETLESLCKYCQEHATDLWVDTVHNIATHIQKSRKS
jgi:peptidoglycan/xylan/chitin deacetylase (PgdA/CDA1 family)